MKNKELYKDFGLRLAVKRKTEAAERMTLSEDFTDRLMQRIAPKPKRRLVWIYPAIGVVAASAVLLLTPRHQVDEEPKETLVAKVEQTEEMPVVAKMDQQEDTTSQMPVSVDAPIRNHIVVGGNPQTAELDAETQNADEVLNTDPNLHYASLKVVSDTVPYQAPDRVDEFIAKLANYHKVKEGELTCSATQDSTVVSSVYVFPDKQEIDLFSRLLQVACQYGDETPGYLLTFSHKQFFFELKDMHKQLQYRWIAERVNGKILLYGTCAPIGVTVSAACYMEYRDELMHTKSINPKTREI